MRMAFIVILLALLTGTGAWWWSRQSGSTFPLPLPFSPTQETADTLIDKENRLLFLQDPDKDAQNDLQAWLIKPDGSGLNRYELPNVATAFKYPSSNLVFFTQTDIPDSFFVKNMATEKIEQHTPIRHPDPEADEHISLYELNNIAPDGSFVIFTAQFVTTCPEFSPPPGFQGGFGPCEPEPDPTLPTGYYLYDLTTKTATHLGETIAVSRWWTEEGVLHYIDHTFNKTGLREINLSSQEITPLDDATTFGYAAWRIFTRPELLVRHTGSTSDSGDASMSKIEVANTDPVDTKVIDTGEWADIQPFAAIFPDESGFLYLRTQHVNGLQVGSLHRHLFDTNETAQLTPPSTTESYSIRGTWVDADHFVTAVDPIEQENYDNTNQYLVNINVRTGEITPLTDKTVTRFNVF